TSQVSSRLRYSPGLLRSASRSSLDKVEATTSGARPEPLLRVVASVMPVWRRERSLLQEVYRLITRPGSLLPVLFGAFRESGGAGDVGREEVAAVHAADTDRVTAGVENGDGDRQIVLVGVVEGRGRERVRGLQVQLGHAASLRVTRRHPRHLESSGWPTPWPDQADRSEPDQQQRQAEAAQVGASEVRLGTSDVRNRSRTVSPVPNGSA